MSIFKKIKDLFKPSDEHEVKSIDKKVVIKLNNYKSSLYVGDKILVQGEVAEIRSSNIVIVKAKSGDYFGAGESSILKIL